MIELTDIRKSFEDNNVLKGVNLSINTGEVVTVIGSSGSGKSTLLRCVNGLEKADGGKLQIKDKIFSLDNISKKEQLWIRRNTAMVFQGFYLFNNKTALENITEGLIVVKKVKREEANRIGVEILDKIGLKDKKSSYPNQLSGGQQQRVSIGRAIALNPEILMLDEPTSALDPELVNEVLMLIKDIAKQKKTMMIVTHEINFARNVSDKIVFMDNGVIVEQGSPKEVIDNPKTERLKNFLLHINKKL
ncbi:amino acid ABC transporter ATP-binding protein [Miniphocaeibacter massiliensis]|uniref:amino acid ABC transporter ATP-binding protein n=1 Tax=Miniphocaeibacter massiliensis TaxID=2041841 RepID=UPI000C1C7E03|nr:amino acid ABC transporter ATP-binding protein [Miniphocaeibacter massiliensis]